MDESPCIKCSEEKRKEMRESHGVNSCKTVCEAWKPFEEHYRKDKALRDKLQRESCEAYAVKLASMRRTRRGKKF